MVGTFWGESKPLPLPALDCQPGTETGARKSDNLCASGPNGGRSPTFTGRSLRSSRGCQADEAALTGMAADRKSGHGDYRTLTQPGGRG